MTLILCGVQAPDSFWTLKEILIDLLDTKVLETNQFRSICNANYKRDKNVMLIFVIFVTSLGAYELVCIVSEKQMTQWSKTL